VTRRRPSPTYADGAADIARRFGITIKTLRHYEEAGLIAPVRDHHGWRSYGQVECERLHLVLLLRRFGLSLGRIGEILHGGTPDIATVIAMQERALREQKARIDEALALLARARAKVEEGRPVDASTLAEMARNRPLGWQWSEELNDLARDVLDARQCRQLAATAPALAGQWAQVVADLERIGTDTPAHSPEARALGARAAGLIARMTGDDDTLRHALADFWQAGFASPDHAPRLPLTREQWRFLGEAMRAHAATEQS
jgi:MerR family transcriptional regulator, thiopeptide resistance regulator